MKEIRALAPRAVAGGGPDVDSAGVCPRISRKEGERTMALTSPNGTPITVRPIKPGELDRVVLRCWPDRAAIDRLFAGQGTIGMAAWEGHKCVGQLHCYRVMLPDGTNPDWPDNGGNWWSGRKVHPEWQNLGPGMPGLGLEGAGWFHSCCHVGRTPEIFRNEIRRLVRGLAQEIGWDAARILDELRKLYVYHTSLGDVENVIKEAERSGLSEVPCGDPDPRYLGRGIGTALCSASIQWAREHGCAAVLALGAPDGLFEFAAWSGHLPWTAYAKLGFKVVDTGRRDDGLSNWAQGDSPPEVMAQVEAALAAGRPPHEFRERLMLLKLKP